MVGLGGRAAIAATVVALLGSAGTARAAPAVSSSDRAATHAYLLDRIAYVRARTAAAGSVRAAEQAVGARIEQECPGVLKGAPTIFSVFEGGKDGRPDERQKGERDRVLSQLADLNAELNATVAAGARQPIEALEQRYREQVLALRWSEPGITSAIGFRIRFAQIDDGGGTATPPAGVCADLRFWAASGFTRESQASKQAHVAREAEALSLFSMREELFGRPPAALVQRFEGSAERALAAELERLEEHADRGRATEITLQDIRVALGAHEKKLSEIVRPSTTLGGGRTHTGGSFTVKLEKGRSGEHPSCRVRVTILGEPRPPGPEQILVRLISGGSEDCVTSEQVFGSGTSCEDGVIQVEATLPPQVRRVRLRLSNGRSVTSRVVLVPKRLGGPFAVYYQELRGPKPVPVGLSELDAAGRRIGTLQLGHDSEACERRRTRQATLDQGAGPDGAPFVIDGADTAGEEASSFEASLDSADQLAFTETPLSTPGAGAFEARVAAGCGAGSYAIVYGRLLPAGASVLARVEGTLVPLTEIALPASLHAAGGLAVAVVQAVPSEFVVHGASGGVVQTISFAKVAENHRRYCEGYAEPPPPPGAPPASG